MVTFKYTAQSVDGQKVSGIIEGYNEMDAVERIKHEHPIVLSVTPVREDGSTGLLNMEIGGQKLDLKAFVVMCNQFAIILRSGVPIARAVELVTDSTTNKPLKRMLKKVSTDVEAGRSLAASFEERGAKLLPETFIETIRAGEESGGLDRAFETVSVHFEKQSDMKGKVKKAMAYPIFVLVIAVIVVIVIMVKVVPTFMAIFESYDAELPLPTRMLIAISNFFAGSWWILLIIAIALVVGIKLYGNTESGRLNLAKLKMKLPVLGKIATLSSASQFANTMTVMLSAGLPLTRAISITARVMDNYYVSQEVGKLAGKIEEGKSLGSCIREIDCLPDILKDMTSVGEETGELEQTLDTIGKFYDKETEAATQAAIAKLEPTMLIILAVVAGFIVIAVYLAMFNMYGAM